MSIDNVRLKSESKRLIKAIRNVIRDPLPRKQVLVFERFELGGGGEVGFHYLACSERYVIRLKLPSHLAVTLRESISPPLEQLLCATGLAFSAFLFKLTDFAAVDVRAAPLDPRSREFFSDFLVGGLGEFRYLQGLDPNRRIEIWARDSDVAPLVFEPDDRLLMLNGGGKDTIVAAELLKRSNQKFGWVTVGANATRRKVIELSGVDEAFELFYDVDKKIEENKRYPWGHVPHTSIVLSIGLLVAVLTKSRYVAVGNEWSANYGNVIYRGGVINHQYTKSSKFEKGFFDFAKRRVAASIDVFSILRPFHDLQLAKLFAGQEKYMSVFVSCNRGINKGVWCKECPKCAFIGLVLYAFSTMAGVRQVFDEDIVHRPTFRKHVLDLVRGTIKPWECVGTRDECVLALLLLLKDNPGLQFKEFPFRKDLEAAVTGRDALSLTRKVLLSIEPDHLIPEELLKKLNRGLADMSDGELSLSPVVSSTA